MSPHYVGAIGRVTRYADTPPPVDPPCTGHGPIFDSTNVANGRVALRICATCPVIDWCKDRYEAVTAAAYDSNGGRPVGTWAGVFYGRSGTRKRLSIHNKEGRTA